MNPKFLLEVVPTVPRSGPCEGGRHARRENGAHHLARHSQRQATRLGHAPLLSDLGFGIVGAGGRAGRRE